MKVKIVKTEEAVGKKLAYDTTLVTKEKAQVLFPKGTVITEDKVSSLKDSGVYYVYVEEEGEENLAYEWEISEQVCKKVVDGETLTCVPGKQGAALIYSKVPGVLSINKEELIKVNKSGIALLITKPLWTAFGQNELVAVVDSLPLYVGRSELYKKLDEFNKAISLQKFLRTKVGLVITGTEIYEGRKQDLYTDIVKMKANKYGWELTCRSLAPDDEDKIAEAINKCLQKSEALIVTGGMSVDATDRTPLAISRSGAKIIAYGIPIKPTTMSLVAFKDDKIIFGISAGGIHYRELNSIDVVFARLMAGWKPNENEIAELGAGGLLPNFEPGSKLH